MKIISHRGAKGLVAEHTAASFEKALEYNVAEIECDVRITKDGFAVMEHDNSLEAPSGKNFEVSDYTYAELIDKKPDLLTLEQAIGLVNKRCILQIELKPNEPMLQVVQIINSFLSHGWSYGDFIVTSRDFGSLKQIKELDDNIPLSFIQPWSGLLAVWRARQLGTKRISMNEHVMWPFFIKSMSRRGWQLSGYTMNDPKRGKKWSDIGLYAIITDYPDRFVTLDT